jgi:zinc protease
MLTTNGRTCLLAVCLVALACVETASGQARANGDVLRATLPNGLRVVIVRNPLSPVVTTVVNYRAGSNEAPAGFPGMAHAEEHMMFRGSPGLSADQLAAISAAMGGNFDADTQQTVTQYFFTVPAEDLDLALHIEAIRMRGALDTQDLWQQERGAIEQEVAQDLSNPEYIFYTKLLAAMFRGTPYAHDALGTRPSFQQTTGEMLKQFHETWYAPNNAILVIAGDVQPEKTLASVRALFGGIPSKKLPARPPVRLEPVKAEKLDFTTDLPYGLAVIAFRLPGSHSPDFAAAQIVADVLSSQRGALYALVPEGKALFAEFAMSSLPEAGMGYALAGFPAGGGGPALADQVRQVVTAEVKKGLDPELVEAAKRQEVAQAEFEKNSVSGLAMAWSEALAVEDKQSPEQNVREIERVTVADVNRVARQYLDMDHAIVAVLTPQPSGSPVSSKGFGGRESFAPKQVKPVPLPDWAKAAMNRLEVPPSAVHPVVTTLANGLTLIVQQESISNTVSVSGHIKNNADLETPKGQEGVSGVLGDLFSYGTATLDRLAFQKALDDIAAEESAGLDFSLRVLPDHFERGVELLADNELHPALPEDAFRIVRQQAAAAQAGQLKSPDYLMRRAIDTALYPPGDPTLREATPATISSVTLPDVKDYFSRTFRPDLTAIVVIGNVTPDRARAAIEKYFGAWKASGPKPETDLPAVPSNKPATTAVPDSSRVQDKVTLAQTLGLNRFNPDYYALQLGNHVLGGAFYATRLYRELRANAGLVYFVDSSFELGRTRGLYSVDYACDPPNVTKARAIIGRELEAMRKAPVTPDELRQAKALLLREIPLAESSVDSIAGGLLSRAIIGLPLDEPTRAARRYLELTAADVQAAFAKWLRPGDLVQVTEGPAPK